MTDLSVLLGGRVTLTSGGGLRSRTVSRGSTERDGAVTRRSPGKFYGHKWTYPERSQGPDPCDWLSDLGVTLGTPVRGGVP